MRAPVTRRRGEIAAWIAVACCVAVVLIIGLAPIAESTSTSSSSNGVLVSKTTHESLVDNEGTSVLLVLAIPLLFALVGAFAVRSRRRVVITAATVLLWIWVVIASFTVGMFYIPAAIALTFAFAWSTESRPDEAG
jgi:hypothetical protein